MKEKSGKPSFVGRALTDWFHQDLNGDDNQLPPAARARVHQAAFEEAMAKPKVVEKPRKTKVAPRKVKSAKKKQMTREDADKIRELMKGLRPSSKRYGQMRDTVAEQTGFSRRQISSAVSGPSRADTRKKNSKKK